MIKGQALIKTNSGIIEAGIEGNNLNDIQLKADLTTRALQSAGIPCALLSISLADTSDNIQAVMGNGTVH